MFNTIIIENFFDNFEYLENHFKKIPLLKYNNYPQNHKARKLKNGQDKEVCLYRLIIPF